MDILQYLIELLKTRKQIGIEGLGTFYKKKTPGRYDAETHSFLPPSYVLKFTTEMLESSNLVQYIQIKRSISEDSAKYFISQFVTEVQNSLQQGAYELENLGAFTKIDGELNFIPSSDINIGFDFFALPSITAEIPKAEAPTDLEEQGEKTHEEVQEEIADVTPENISQQIDEPEVEQIKVPEFEQELDRITGEPAIVPTYEEDKPEEETSEEITTEDDVAQEEIEKKLVEVEEQTESIENNEHTEEVFEEIAEANTIIPSTEPELINNGTTIEEEQIQTIENEEIFEEIAEVNTAILPTEPELPNQQEENEDWNFDGENVVSANDIRDEEINKNEYKGASNEIDDNTVFSDQSHYRKKEDDHNIKLTATTHEWDFDNTDNKETKEDGVLIGEFDTNEIEEKIEEEKSGMSVYQKLGLTLIVLLVLLAITYFIAPSLFESFNRNAVNPNQKNAVPPIENNLKTQQDSLSFADSIMQNAEKVGLDVQPAKDTLKATTVTKSVNTVTYEIVGAALGNTKEVEQYIANVKRIGLVAKEIPGMPGKLRKISLASYNNRDSAIKDLKKYRQLLKNKEIYIFSNKNN